MLSVLPIDMRGGETPHMGITTRADAKRSD